ncbi:MAG: calcium/sodium antiporter [Lachnospiraceae bacterium]|nr:calcium/sodium antiporter [Lachnospiraceae bacterium]
MLVAVLLFVLGLICLIKGGDWFVDGSTGIARAFRIPEILIGATVVSIGTTLPEVMVSATGAIGGHSEMAYGNAIGSIICNTALIAAITIAFKPSKVDKKSLVVPVAFFFTSFALYAATAYIAGYFDRIVGSTLLVIFVVYIIVSVRQARNNPDKSHEDSVEEGENEKGKVRPLWLDIVLLIIGAALIAVGARLLVDNGTIIATELGVPESVIALTFVALGTSLPELVTSVTSLIKGHGALGLGNVIGANIFNLVLVSGLATVLSPFAVPAQKTLLGVNASLLVDLPVALIAMLILTLPALSKGKMFRVQGIVLLLMYFGFCVFQFA